MPVIFGAFIECVATCIYRVVSRGLSELNPRFSTVIDSFIGTSLVVAGASVGPEFNLGIFLHVINLSNRCMEMKENKDLYVVPGAIDRVNHDVRKSVARKMLISLL